MSSHTWRYWLPSHTLLHTNTNLTPNSCSIWRLYTTKCDNLSLLLIQNPVFPPVQEGALASDSEYHCPSPSGTSCILLLSSSSSRKNRAELPLWAKPKLHFRRAKLLKSWPKKIGQGFRCGPSPFKISEKQKMWWLKAFTYSLTCIDQQYQCAVQSLHTAWPV